MTRSLRRAGLALALAVGLALAAHAGRAPEVRQQANTWLNEGVSAFQQGNYREAVAKLERCAAVWLNSFRAYYYLGRAYLAARRPSQALEALAVALDLGPTHLGAHVAFGDAYLALGDPESARAAYYRALDLRPEFAPALDGIARAYQAQGKPEQAVPFFERAIASDRAFGPAYVHLADLLLEQRRVGDALRVLQEAIAVRPDFAPAYDRLALASIRLGLESEAVSAVHKAIELEPRAPDHHVTLGQVLTDLGRFESARRALEQALELDPEHLGALEALAELERRQGDYERARAALDRALALPELDPLVRQRLEEQREQLALEARTAAALRSRINSGDGDPAAWRAWARLLAAQGAWAEAAEALERAGPAPEDRAWLAYLWVRAGRCREAARLLRELLAGEPSARLWLNLGTALACTGDHDGAAEAYARAASLDPDLALAKLYWANALLRAGKVEQALSRYLEFLELEPQGARAELVRRCVRRLAPERVPEKPDTEGGASP